MTNDAEKDDNFGKITWNANLSFRRKDCTDTNSKSKLLNINQIQQSMNNNSERHNYYSLQLSLCVKK